MKYKLEFHPNPEYDVKNAVFYCVQAIFNKGTALFDEHYSEEMKDSLGLSLDMEDFRGKIYSYHHPYSDRYPQYGGELFEKRVDSWLRVNDFHRATLKNGHYIHRNFTNNPWKKKLSILLNRPDLFS